MIVIWMYVQCTHTHNTCMHMHILTDKYSYSFLCSWSSPPTRLENPAFKEFCAQKEKSRSCQGLSLISFLLLPMQRITRLPLLVLAVLNRVPFEDPERDLVERTLKTVQEVCQGCVSTHTYVRVYGWHAIGRYSIHIMHLTTLSL